MKVIVLLDFVQALQCVRNSMFVVDLNAMQTLKSCIMCSAVCVCVVLEMSAAVTCCDCSPVLGMGHIAFVNLVSAARPKVATYISCREGINVVQ